MSLGVATNVTIVYCLGTSQFCAVIVICHMTSDKFPDYNGCLSSPCSHTTRSITQMHKGTTMNTELSLKPDEALVIQTSDGEYMIDERVYEVLNDEELWRDFRRELSNSMATTSVAVKHITERFMQERLSEQTNFEAKRRAQSTMQDDPFAFESMQAQVKDKIKARMSFHRVFGGQDLSSRSSGSRQSQTFPQESDSPSPRRMRRKNSAVPNHILTSTLSSPSSSQHKRLSRKSSNVSSPSGGHRKSSLGIPLSLATPSLARRDSEYAIQHRLSFGSRSYHKRTSRKSSMTSIGEGGSIDNHSSHSSKSCPSLSRSSSMGHRESIRASFLKQLPIMQMGSGNRGESDRSSFFMRRKSGEKAGDDLIVGFKQQTSTGAFPFSIGNRGNRRRTVSEVC